MTAASTSVPPAARIQIVLQQAYQSDWQAPGCETQPTATGNLALDCPAARVLQGPLELEFRDPLSDWAAQVSILMWKTWMGLVTAVLLVPTLAALRDRRAAAA